MERDQDRETQFLFLHHHQFLQYLHIKCTQQQTYTDHIYYAIESWETNDEDGKNSKWDIDRLIE